MENKTDSVETMLEKRKQYAQYIEEIDRNLRNIQNEIAQALGTPTATAPAWAPPAGAKRGRKPGRKAGAKPAKAAAPAEIDPALAGKITEALKAAGQAQDPAAVAKAIGEKKDIVAVTLKAMKDAGKLSFSRPRWYSLK